MTWLPRLSAALAAGAALGAVFPLLGWSGLAWVALVPLLVVVATVERARAALLPGYAAGAVFFAMSCPWIMATVHRYGDLSGATAGLVFLLFLALMGAYLALFAVAGACLGLRTGHRLLPLPFLWVAVEWLRTYTPIGGFPWNLLGYAQVNNLQLMRLASLTGVYGVSLALAVANTLVAGLAIWAWRKLRRGEAPGRGPRWAAVGPAVALVALLGAAYWPYSPPALGPATLRARLVQPNTSVDTDWTAASLQQFFASQLALSTPDQPVNLIVWPEQPTPLDYALQPDFQQMTAELVSGSRAGFLFGEVSYPLTAQGGPDYSQPRNSAQFIAANGTTGGRYDKIHLVPFGEYVPLPGWLRRIAGVGKLVQDVGDFVPGTRAVLFELGGHRFGTMICYESIFPGLARQEVADGAEWLVNQSDDSWYGTSSAAAQGLMMARMRAIENRRWMLRDTDDGITAVIDPYGRVTARLPRAQAAALEAGFAARSGLTFYTRHGDWLAAACAGIIGLITLYGLRRAATRTPGSGRQGP